MSQWTEYQGPVPKGLGIIPLGEIGRSATGHWVKRTMDGRIFTAPMVKKAGLAGTGLGFNPSGNNFLVTASDADAACAGNFGTASGGWPASIQADIVAWEPSASVGQSIFVWSGDDKKLYQFVKDAANHASLMVCSDGPMTQPGTGGGGGGGQQGGTTTTQTTLQKALPWVLGGLGVAAVGTVIYVATKKPKRHHGASESRHRRRRRRRRGRR